MKRTLTFLAVALAACAVYAQTGGPGLPVLPGGGSGGSGTIGGSTGATDNSILRADGVGGATLQNSVATISDTTGVFRSADGAVGLPTYGFTSDPDTGFYLNSDGIWALAGAGLRSMYGSGALVQVDVELRLGLNTAMHKDYQYTWSSTTNPGGTKDTGLARSAAGMVKVTDGSTGIRGLLGGGAAVASATAMPVPTGRVFHVTGTTTITSITSTNFQTGACVSLIFDDVLTFTDGSNLKLAGDFVTTADDTISLCYDGTNWYETSRSVI